MLDLLNEPWAITPTKLQAMCNVYETHLSGVKLDEAAIQAAIGQTPQSRSSAGYKVQNGVAVIPVQGVLSKRMNLFTAFSGGTSTEILVDTVNEAIEDPTVTALLLDVDSPGGEVDGTQQIADAVRSSTKPTMAFVDGLGASAAMWIASQCGSIYAASDTSEVGSISVVYTHVDASKQNAQRGVSKTHITTGKYKRIANSDEPLSQDGREYLQSRADYLHTLFVTAVADGRGISADQADDQWADGRLFFAQQAVDNGLVDGICSFDDCIAKLTAEGPAFDSNRSASALPNPRTGATVQPFKSFATEAEYNSAIATARSEGATAERERIAAIEATPLAAQYPDVIKGLKADGKSGKAEAALAVLEAEQKGRNEHAAGLKDDAPKLAPYSVAGDTANFGAMKDEPPRNGGNAGSLASQITAHQAKAKAEGRTLTTSQALAELEAPKR